ncbi:MAG: AraC family ligand binding domain-containing protein [Mesorhizobium sp.]
MDFSADRLHYPTMLLRNVTTRDALYGESPAQAGAFRFHCETLYSRSSLHRFEIDLHRHEAFVQFLYISTGEGDAILNGVSQQIRPPAVIIVPPSFEHGFRFSRNIGGLIVTALPSTLSASAQALLRSHMVRPALVPLHDHAEAAAIDATFERIAREHAQAEPGWDVFCEGQITSLVALLARTMPPPNHGATLDVTTRRFETLLALIAAHIREMPPATFYAERLGISQTQLNRLVREKSGSSLRQAHRRPTDRTCTAGVAFHCLAGPPHCCTSLGFSDPAYFSRFFLHQTGTTPHRWRERARTNLASEE